MGGDLSQLRGMTAAEQALLLESKVIQTRLDSLKGLMKLLSFIIIALCVCSLGFNVMRTLIIQTELLPLRAALKHCQLQGCKGETFKEAGDMSNG